MTHEGDADNAFFNTDVEPEEIQRILTRLAHNLAFRQVLADQRDGPGAGGLPTLPELPSPADIEAHLTELRSLLASLRGQPPRRLTGFLGYLLNLPFRLFGRKQMWFDAEVLAVAQELTRLVHSLAAQSRTLTAWGAQLIELTRAQRQLEELAEQVQVSRREMAHLAEEHQALRASVSDVFDQLRVINERQQSVAEWLHNISNWQKQREANEVGAAEWLRNLTERQKTANARLAEVSGELKGTQQWVRTLAEKVQGIEAPSPARPISDVGANATQMERSPARTLRRFEWQAGVTFYAIAFIFRSGSNALCEYLTVNGLGQPTEYFKIPFGEANRHHYEAMGIAPDDFRSFLTELVSQRSPNGIFGCKLAWHQKNALLAQARECFEGVEEIEDIFPDIWWFFLRRRDRIAQAVSRWRAQQSGQWLSGEPVTGELYPAYDYEGLLECFRNIVAQEQLWKDYFERRQLRPQEVWYEDLCLDPQRVVFDLARSIQAAAGVELIRDMAEVKLISSCAVQRDEYSEEIKALFTRDLYRIGVDHPD